MRSTELCLASAVIATLVLVEAAAAQPSFQTQGPPREFVPPPPISVDEIVERIMAFDKNKDGKVTKDELPERMHHLIALGDTNKDGALDREEIRKLASTPGGLGPVGAGPAGVGPVDLFVGGRTSPAPGGTAGFAGPGPAVIEGVVDDLKLSGKKKDQALEVAKAHRENVRKLMEQARAEMLLKMKAVLSEQEFKDFQAALDRPRGAVLFNVGP